MARLGADIALVALLLFLFHADQPFADKVLLLGVLATGILGLPIIAALDRFHWHVLPRPQPIMAAAGLVSFIVGWVLKNLALRTNAFAIAVVRTQRERAHVVADSGPYRIVRHPFYAADPLILVGLGVWLESYVAALAAAIPVALMVVRLRLEERYLRCDVAGYAEYEGRVRYRLVPGLW